MVAKREEALPPLEKSEEASLKTEESEPSPLADAARAAILPPMDGITARDPKLAAYIGQMALEMSSMARAANFDLLAYFLDMARIEANIQAGKDS